MAKLQVARDNTRKRMSAFDAFIIIALILCIAFSGLRVYFTKFAEKNEVIPEDYVVSFSIANIRASSGNLFREGMQFYINGTGEQLGAIASNVTITPAKLYIFDSNGQSVLTYYPDNGDDGRIDVTGVMNVSGTVDEKGFFRLNSETVLAPNMTVTVSSENMVAQLTIRDIAKAK